MIFDLSTFKHQKLFANRMPWEVLIALQEYFQTLSLGNHKGEISSKATIINPELVTIESGACIAPEALIEGPCYIGSQSKIGHGAFIRPYSLIGEMCVVGHASEVKHSIFLNGAKAPHFNYVGDSILGNGVNLGAGVICANLRVDKGPVKVFFEGEVYETGLSKLGAFVGDQTQIGCNSVTNPGAVFDPHTLAPPCTSLRGGRSIESESIQEKV
jgi:UDP-N-acetylglucosamine diphosphorylase / glucose-1-phosphate thymidylyltransferase / UDP-N-acetylgalactosamine diphosphorylase / glucosamine-1-phosphate N-acetyltransferase / galactosamine-1-phosphate N-acetyltransferase